MSSSPAEVATPRDKLSIAALLASVFFANTASIAGVTIVGKQVYDLTGRKIDLGLLGLIEFAPAALLVLVVGTIADRFDRRRVSALALIGEIFSAAGLAWYASTEPTAVSPIFLMVLGFGTARAFISPTLRALPADIVAPQRVPWLMARYSGTWQAAIIVGPVLAGFLYTRNHAYPYIAMVILLMIAALCVLSIGTRSKRPRELELEALAATSGLERTEPIAPPKALHEALAGFRFIRKEPVLLGAISLDLFAVLFGGAVALLPAIAKDQLGVDAVGLGWLRAAVGIGASSVTLGLAIRPLRRNIGRTLLTMVATFGIFTIVLGMTRSFAVAFVSLVILSGADAISVFVRATLVPLITPVRMRGRVLALENVFIGASNELGAFESGVAAQLIGTSPAVVLGGVATVVIAAVWSQLFPGLRDIDHFPDNSA